MSDIDTKPTTPQRTPLHAWHVANGARMVRFADFEMPVHYAAGIIQEHLATRSRAGLFDVSHMGRFRVRGSHARSFLAGVLTSNVAALTPGSAQYTFIATPEGGAVDDAYLYMLDDDDYLLVVNAANRSHDWQWLSEHAVAGASLDDESEATATIALQGPAAETLLAPILSAGTLPPPQRNALAYCELLGERALVARTGYTGEAVCFEIFSSASHAPALWQRLSDAGATAVGLGARDSLRLEAALPLYGHELGDDRDGNPIPLFANALARFGVRPPGNGDYIGRAALDAQRVEFERIRSGDLARGWQPEHLTQTVQCVLASEGRRPIRAGHSVLHQTTRVGDLTSGGVVPVANQGTGDDGAASTHTLNRIGLALIDCRYRYRKGDVTRLTACDDRGRETAIALVARHLRP